MFRYALFAFLALAAIGFIGWVAVKFTRPILGVGQDGFLLLTLVALGFVVALSLSELALRGIRDK